MGLKRWTSLDGGSGNFNTDAAGTVKGGTALQTNLVAKGSLSCLFVVDAETNTLTLEHKWQVSNDNSTWYDFPPENNAAVVVLATGTAGADAAVSKAIAAPRGIEGWKYVRACVVNGVTTGNTADTYAMTYRYLKYSAFDKG